MFHDETMMSGIRIGFWVVNGLDISLLQGNYFQSVKMESNR